MRGMCVDARIFINCFFVSLFLLLFLLISPPCNVIVRCSACLATPELRAISPCARPIVLGRASVLVPKCAIVISYDAILVVLLFTNYLTFLTNPGIRWQ